MKYSSNIKILISSASKIIIVVFVCVCVCVRVRRTESCNKYLRVIYENNHECYNNNI